MQNIIKARLVAFIFCNFVQTNERHITACMLQKECVSALYEMTAHLNTIIIRGSFTTITASLFSFLSLSPSLSLRLINSEGLVVSLYYNSNSSKTKKCALR